MDRVVNGCADPELLNAPGWRVGLRTAIPAATWLLRAFPPTLNNQSRTGADKGNPTV